MKWRLMQLSHSQLKKLDPATAVRKNKSRPQAGGKACTSLGRRHPHPKQNCPAEMPAATYVNRKGIFKDV